MSNSAFFYVDGIPTKGTWVDLDFIEAWEDIRQQLESGGFCTSNYDGDILVADTEGALAGIFYQQYGGFDLSGFVGVRDGLDETKHEAYAAFVGWYGQGADISCFEDAYIGEYDSELGYAKQYLDDSGILSQIPESLQCYFDVKAFSRDLFINDYYFVDGFVFINN